MKKRLMCLLATLGLIILFIPAGVPVAAAAPGDGQFTPQDIPSTTDYVLLTGSNILDFAVGSDGMTIYAVNTVASNLILKSVDAGQSWDNVQNNLLTAAGAGFLPTVISVAPDNVNAVAVSGAAGNVPMVVISNDGGITWATIPAPPSPVR